jgi:hypothetical protein
LQWRRKSSQSEKISWSRLPWRRHAAFLKAPIKTIIPSRTNTAAGALLLLLLFCAGVCPGQVPVGTATNQLDSTNFVCVQAGPYSKVWQRALLSTNADDIVTTNYQSYEELATGISYLSNGKYVDSVEQVEPVPGGAQAVQGRYQVQWALNANTPGGAVTVTTADGKQLASRVFGFAYYDVASGSNVAIAGLTNCNGSIVAPNQVLYAGAFSNVNADLLYTYTKAGLSQDIVLHQAPLGPDTYGLSDESTILQVYTEFFNPPQPQITAVTNANVIDDQILDFGDMKMGMGQALFLNAQDEPLTAGSVTKQWVQINNGTFLIESIPYQTISNQLQQLPQASNLKPGRGSVRRLAFLPSNPSRPGASVKGSTPMKLARAETTKPRLKLDYELLSSSANLTLQGDTTYLVTSLVNITGTTTIEGGTVVKYTNSASAQIATPNIVCLTAPYGPGVFTSMYDSSVGTVITNSTNTPARGVTTYLNVTVGEHQAPVFRNLRFSYAEQAISANINSSATSIELWDSQFINCGTALYAGLTTCGFPIYAYNVLLSHCTNGFNGNTSGCFSVSAVNITADEVGTFLLVPNENDCAATNCIFTSVTNLSGVSPFVNCCTNASSAGIYQPVGAGGYYLATNSTNRAVGTTKINTNLLADLQTLTTYPPVVTNGWITTDYTFTPQVPRNTGAPDRGYHYFPIDWAVNIQVSNATVTVVPGTVLAGCGSNYGVYLYSNGNIDGEGTATSPNYFVQYNTVQEQSNPNWTTTNWTALLLTPEVSGSSWVNFAFTDWSVLTANGLINSYEIPTPFTLQDCQFYGGLLNAQGLVMSATNCLFQRVNFSATDLNAGNISIAFYNNLFWQGELSIGHFESGTFTFRDNFLDQTAYTQLTNRGVSKQIDLCSNNAYVTTNFGVVLPENHDQIMTASPAFQTGWLGPYYYPTNFSPTNVTLIHTGSQSAEAAGLYFYTVLTNNTIEGTNTVSIGFHYVATDTNGVPLDAGGGGAEDYLQDPNGNGVLNPFLIFDQALYPNEPQVRLGYWKFDNTNNWTNQSGLYPTTSNFLTGVRDWSSNAVSFTTNTNSLLVYPVTHEGANYFNPANGTIRFWYQPNWSTTNPSPPNSVAFFESSCVSGYWEFASANITNASGDHIDNLLGFSTESNLDQRASSFNTEGLNGALLNFQSNLWYQIVLTYSPSNVAVYANGAFLASATVPPDVTASQDPIYGVGSGNIYYPPVIDLTSGFSFGNQNNGLAPVMGQLDELETFNYPLTLQQVAAGYPYFGGNSSNMTDTYYVGRSDMLQTYVDGIPPSLTNTNFVQCRLGYWRFDSPLLYAEQGQMPLSSSSVGLAPSWSGTALVISNGASQITYPDVGSNGWANINCRQGSVRFWFKPNSTTGPGTSAPFFYMGTTNGSQEWALLLNSSGTSISFTTASNVVGGTNTYFNYSIALTNTNAWTQIVLAYGSNDSYLYINGVSVATGLAVAYWPSVTNRHLGGMVIGNNLSNNAAINGQFEEMETFNYELTPSEITANYQIVASVDSNLNGIPDLLEDIPLTTARPFLGAPVVITGTIVAAQFDMGGPGKGYSNTFVPPTNSYRPTGMCITNCTDLGGGYCLDQMQSNEWTQYTINVLVPQTYMVDVRAQAIGTHTGGVFLCEFTNTNGFHTNTGSMTIPSTNWTDVTNVLYLTNGVTVMKLLCTNNAPGSTNVGRFNYISIYPWWHEGVTNITGTNTITLITNGSAGPNTLIPGTNNSWYAATNNSIQIQNAVSSLNPVAGGEIILPAGTFLIAQLNPNEANDAYQNAAVSILGNNNEIKGQGETTTTLIAYNRATTVFSVGEDTHSNTAQCANFTLRDMTIEAQPHREVSGTTNTVYDAGMFIPTGGDGDAGALTIVYGLPAAPSNEFAYNILVTNCQFLSADRSIVMPWFVSNVMVRDCNFIPSGLKDTWGSNNVYTGQTSLTYEVGIEVRGGSCYNLVVLSNTYDGNILITTTNSSYEASWLAPDGLVYFQAEGNAFIAGNFITNNEREAVQLNAGPASVAGNTFYTLVNYGSCCALDAYGSSQSGATGTNSINYSTCFVGNSVYGGRTGEEGTQATAPFTINVANNSLYLYPPFDVTNDSPSAAVSVAQCQVANVCGNTLSNGGLGFHFTGANSGALILNNNFASASYRGIGYYYNGDSLSTAEIFGNTLGQGVSFHVQLPYTNSFGWFLGSNTFYNASSTSVPLFADPASSAIHIFN